MLLPFIYLFMFPCLVKTYSFKKPFWLWTAIIYPPIGLLTLIWVPIDFTPSMLWLPAIIAFFVSLITTVINVVRIVFRLVKNRDASDLPLRFIRPFLTTLTFSIAIFTVQMSLASADKYGIEIAQQIQAMAETERACPLKIKGWQTTPSPQAGQVITSKLSYGEYVTKYPLRYNVSEDQKNFSLMVKHSIDTSLILYGGVGTPLRAYDSFEGGRVGRDIESYGHDIDPLLNLWLATVTILSIIVSVAAFRFSKPSATTESSETTEIPTDKPQP